MPSEPNIIRFKISIPESARYSARRERVEALFAELVENHRVTLITATAGAGKTTAVAEFARHQKRPVAWLSVDLIEQAPGRFLTYLEAAVGSALPTLEGVVTEAMTAGLSHREAAGLLGEAIGEHELLFVVDDAERLEGAGDSWEVLVNLIRYAPPTVRFIILSRRDLPVEATRPGEAGLVDEHDLAFTIDEASAALARLGATEVDEQQAVDATGGWVTGVLFEAWRSSDHVAGAGGEADPLHGYLASHILAQLPESSRRLLVDTALLTVVTAARAEAMDVPDAAAELNAMRSAHLPVSWEEGGRVMRCHPRFREYLLELLQREGGERLGRLRHAFGTLLAEEGHYEEATEALLQAGYLDEALDTAEQAIMAVIERFDLAIAERWIAQLEQAPSLGLPPRLTTARLMLAIAQDDYRRAIRIADGRGDNRGEAARRSPRAAALMAWAYLHAARLDEAIAVLAVAEPDPTVETAKIAVQVAGAVPADAPPLAIPDPSGGPLDVMVMRIAYLFGRLKGLRDTPRSRWEDAIISPWRIASLRATGHTEEALRLYLAAIEAGAKSVALLSYIGPETLIDAGRLEEARTALDAGRRLADASGSLGFKMFNLLADVKLRLRVEGDTRQARRILDRAGAELGDRRFPFAREQLNMWDGFARLLEGEDGRALALLRDAVASMREGRRIIELATAAVYLSEAEWRAGEEERADAAAALALEVAGAQGSNHLLLQALADFPAVAWRAMDAEPDPDSPWHEIGRALRVQAGARTLSADTTVLLRDFGPPELLVEGEARKPRLAKSYELLAYLARSENRSAGRAELLEALFEDKRDDSTRAYLRQAIHQLRGLMPEPVAILTEGQTVALAANLRLGTETDRFETKLSEAARLQGEERLAETIHALRLPARGPFLEGADSDWVEERRRELAQSAAEARFSAAEAAFSLGRYTEAKDLSETALAQDQFAEAAWRLRMRVADALGDGDGVIRAYQSCERALASIDASPSTSTRQLLENLRR